MGLHTCPRPCPSGSLGPALTRQPHSLHPLPATPICSLSPNPLRLPSDWDSHTRAQTGSEGGPVEPRWEPTATEPKGKVGSMDYGKRDYRDFHQIVFLWFPDDLSDSLLYFYYTIYHHDKTLYQHKVSFEALFLNKGWGSVMCCEDSTWHLLGSK